MKAPVDTKKVVPIEHMRGEDPEESRLLREMAEEAEDHARAVGGTVRQLFFGGGIGGVVAVFLAEIEEDAGLGPWTWIIVGDLPPAHLPVGVNQTPASALLAYIAIMREWVEAVRQGKSGRSINVTAPPDAEHADMLDSRLKMLEEDVFPFIRDYWD